MACPHQTDDERSLRRYLLGELSEEERDRLQAAYFADDELFDRLLGAEDDLIDAYVRGELTADERARFERHLLVTAEQQQRVVFARRLQSVADERPTAAAAAMQPDKPTRWHSVTGWWRGLTAAPVLALAAVVLIAVALGVVWRVMHHRSEPSGELVRQQTLPVTQQTTTPEPSGVPEQPSGGTPPASIRERTADTRTGRSDLVGRAARAPNGAARQPRTPSAAVASVLLVPGAVRDGGETVQLLIPPATKWAEVRLEVVSTGHARYRVEVQTAEGAAVFRQSGLTARPSSGGRLVSVRVPGAVLTKKDYVVLLSGEVVGGTPQYLGGYSFEVTRK